MCGSGWHVLTAWWCHLSRKLRHPISSFLRDVMAFLELDYHFCDFTGHWTSTVCRYQQIQSVKCHQGQVNVVMKNENIGDYSYSIFKVLNWKRCLASLMPTYFVQSSIILLIVQVIIFQFTEPMNICKKGASKMKWRWYYPASFRGVGSGSYEKFHDAVHQIQRNIWGCIVSLTENTGVFAMRLNHEVRHFQNSGKG